ncbi:T6SS phospholipase effector Tle1-like catalytic domain-containing protein [Proteus myxofaciens]|uniref:DUF2235 domain-containing protein n=1 Tax=Proteus myxofaciens ATCC 19692 TaxID=1354337 RepID=A0A198G8D3_9GAMM|nr:DUF2235 domain-containing protein [Proteus myxofaciens]OAT33220.1 hypothetical protein M983_1197 [Proteus myxofaciens ATCC 19692]
MSPMIIAPKKDQVSTQGAPCWVPPLFPLNGRLALTEKQLIKNIEKIRQEEFQHRSNCHRELKNSCCKSLHISLFFDGTNNNEPNDTSSTPPHPSNVAKLYHASAPENRQANERGFYAYYIPGVGTPFPQIGTYDYYSAGLQFAVGGEDRINWGLVQLCNALYHAVTKDFIKNGIMKKMVETMNSSDPSRMRSRNAAIMAATSPTNFNREKINQAYLDAVSPNNNQHRARLDALEKLLIPIKKKVSDSQCKIVAIKLFVYGFSRGAAEARAFVSWLDELLSSNLLGFPAGTLLGVKVSVEFLGIFDTVPAVGIANVVPGFTGHNGWAGQTQPLPQSALIKKCCHFVAANEQRQAFSLDSIRTAEGHYLPHTVEVVYPGMHSDVGGGYPMGDQGKSRDNAGDLLSQITLHDMYAAAIEAGAPLAVHPETLNQLSADYQQWYSFRKMNDTTVKEFDFSLKLVSTFNHWLSTTLIDNQNEYDLSEDPIYTPFRFETVCLEQIMEEQLSWITGWRIMRFASSISSLMNIASQPFFQQASQHPKIQAQPYEPGYSQQAQNALAEQWSLLTNKSQQVEKKRNIEIAKYKNNEDWYPSDDFIGAPLFDADNSRGQLWEAALEFAADYERRSRPTPLFTPEKRQTKNECIIKTRYLQSSNSAYFAKEGITQPFPVTHCEKLPEYSFDAGTALLAEYFLQKLDPLLARSAYIYTYQNEAYEYLKFKDAGRYKFEHFFLPHLKNQIPNPKIGSLINLYDNYIHDSRAWFMHSESGVREPFGSYFLSRMIYFGSKWNKAVQLRFDGDHILGVEKHLQDMAVFAHHPTYGVKVYHRTTGQEISVDDGQLPALTHNFIHQLKPLVTLKKANKEAQVFSNLQKIVNDTFIS